MLCCQILSPVVFFLANSALKSGTVPPQDVGTTNIAKILGIVGTVFLVLGIILRLTGVLHTTGSVTTTGMAPVASHVITIPAGK